MEDDIGIVIFCNDTATAEIYTLSLHDTLPISRLLYAQADCGPAAPPGGPGRVRKIGKHTSEL